MERTTIEIYVNNPQEEKREIKDKIEEILRNKKLLSSEMTIVSFACNPESCYGSLTYKPFLRVMGTDSTVIHDIRVALREAKIGMDFEWGLLSGFITKEKMGA